MREVLRRRDLRLLLTAEAAAEAGEWLYSLTLVVVILDLTGSAAWVAAAALVRLVPWIVLSPIGGLLADHLDRRLILVWCGIVQLVAMVLLAVASWTGAPPVALLAIAGIAGLGSVCMSPAVQAAVPELVAERELSAVNSLLTSISSVSLVVGPGLGGLLLLLGSPALAFGLNALVFAVAAAGFAAIRAPMGPPRRDPARRGESQPGTPAAESSNAGTGGSSNADTAPAGLGTLARELSTDLVHGVRVLGSSPAAIALVLVSSATWFASGAQGVLWVLLADQRLGAGADALTILYVAFGLGGIAGTIPAARAAARRSALSLLGGIAILAGLLVVPLAVAGTIGPALALVAVQGFAIMVADVLGITLLQRTLGPAVLGRAIGTINSTTSVAMVAGSIMAPIAVAAGGLELAFLIIAVVLVGVGGLALIAARTATRRAPVSEARVQVLNGLAIFANAPRFALEGLAAGARELRVRASTDVVRVGGAPDALYVIVDGSALVTAADGSRLNVLGAGDFFGEIGIVKGVPRTATVTMTAASTLLRIEADAFLALIRDGAVHHGALGRSVGARLAHRPHHDEGATA